MSAGKSLAPSLSRVASPQAGDAADGSCHSDRVHQRLRLLNGHLRMELEQQAAELARLRPQLGTAARTEAMVRSLREQLQLLQEENADLRSEIVAVDSEFRAAQQGREELASYITHELQKLLGAQRRELSEKTAINAALEKRLAQMAAERDRAAAQVASLTEMLAREPASRTKCLLKDVQNCRGEEETLELSPTKRPAEVTAEWNSEAKENDSLMNTGT